MCVVRSTSNTTTSHCPSIRDSRQLRPVEKYFRKIYFFVGTRAPRIRSMSVRMRIKSRLILINSLSNLIRSSNIHFNSLELSPNHFVWFWSIVDSNESTSLVISGSTDDSSMVGRWYMIKKNHCWL